MGIFPYSFVYKQNCSVITKLSKIPSVNHMQLYYNCWGELFASPQLLVTRQQSLVTSHQSLVANHQLLVTSYQSLLASTSYQLRVAINQLLVFNHYLPLLVTSYQSRIASKVTIYQLLQIICNMELIRHKNLFPSTYFLMLLL